MARFRAICLRIAASTTNAMLHHLQHELKEQRAAPNAHGDCFAQQRVLQIEAKVTYLTERLARKLSAPEADAPESVEMRTSEDPADQGQAMIFVYAKTVSTTLLTRISQGTCLPFRGRTG